MNHGFSRDFEGAGYEVKAMKKVYEDLEKPLDQEEGAEEREAGKREEQSNVPKMNQQHNK